MNKRNPYQKLLDKKQTEYQRGLYDAFPAFELDDERIDSGYAFLADKIHKQIPEGLRVLVVDGFSGVDWHRFRSGLEKSLDTKNIAAEWIEMDKCLADPETIRQRIEPFMGGDDRVFGAHYPFGPEVFFDADKAARCRIQMSIARGAKAGHLLIVYGHGAGLLELWDQLWYIDYPKDLLQMKARAGKQFNIGDNRIDGFEAFYKRAYFIEWPALNRLKRRLLPQFDLFIDLQNPDNPVSMTGHDFRQMLKKISESPFRVRPWFFPGPWGGQFMKGHMGLAPDAPNLAWSFELIVPENGIVVRKKEALLEFSFDFIMYQENQRILGREAAKQFKYEWPIRLDYLDTVDGGNLSTQVHPRPDYIRREFGETYTQDETYYVITAKPDARVYLGLTGDCDPRAFKAALDDSEKYEQELEIDRFVNGFPSKAHDLFLIPNGTVHCSGAGNLVLEISATPYIFTFKIYDYLRRDLEGRLRPINIERGFENIRFDRRTEWVERNLLAKPRLIESGKDWQRYIFYDKPFTFYRIERIDFGTVYETETADRALAINLVEGQKIEITTKNGRSAVLSYIESMIIPAAAEKVEFRNLSEKPCKLVMVYVKPGIGVDKPLNDPQDG